MPRKPKVMTMNNDDEPQELSYAEAVALLPDGEEIHTFMQGGSILLGADWSRAHILDLLRTSPRREVTGAHAQAMSHGLAAIDEDDRTVFIETRSAPE
jgi:hypothetical protein